jgi:pimeloyl-ACP methyl ester carboxylesterase
MRLRNFWLSVFVVLVGAFISTTPVAGQAGCGPDGVQASGSIYRICMPDAEDYNGHLVIWAHGFQDAIEPVGIPDEQLEFGDVTIPGLVNDLGFGFATNSYSKTGLAIVQGRDDILDLVEIFTAEQGAPEKVFLVGASEGGIITALLVEQNPETFAGGLAICGPVGDFAQQIDYFGDSRVTFEYFFPGLIPGDPLAPSPELMEIWSEYYEDVVRPTVFAPANAGKLAEWAAVAKLPFDPDNLTETLGQSVRDVLRYSVVNLNDAVATIGGFPFENRWRWYSGSNNDWALNMSVQRAAADPVAIAEMDASYDTTGNLAAPLITLHTTLDQQVPYFHENLYVIKTLLSGALFHRHLNLAIDRYGHCNVTAFESLVSLFFLLAYTDDLDLLFGPGSDLDGGGLAGLEALAGELGMSTTE